MDFSSTLGPVGLNVGERKWDRVNENLQQSSWVSSLIWLNLEEFSSGKCFFCGLPRWLSGKESTYQCRKHRFHPWVRKIPWWRKWQPTPVFLPGKSHGQRSLEGYSPWGCKSIFHTSNGKFNWNDHYIYYHGQESLRINGVVLIVNKIVRNTVLGCNLKKDRMISVHFQGKTFNITVIQICAPTTNANEEEVEWLCDDLQDLELTQKRMSFLSQGTGMQK